MAGRLRGMVVKDCSWLGGVVVAATAAGCGGARSNNTAAESESSGTESSADATTGPSSATEVSDSSSETAAETASESSESGSPRLCGNAIVDPGEHCDGGEVCPPGCVWEVGAELWRTQLGQSAGYVTGKGPARQGRAVSEAAGVVYTGYRNLEDEIALVGLDVHDGSGVWQYAIENAGTPCSDCQDAAFLYAVAANQAGACAVGSTLIQDGGGVDSQGVVFCLDAAGQVIMDERLAVAEYGPSLINAITVAPDESMVAHARAIESMESFTLEVDGTFQLSTMSPFSHAAIDLQFGADELYVLDGGSASKLDAMGNAEWSTELADVELADFVVRDDGSVMVAGARQYLPPGAPAYYQLVWAVLGPDGEISETYEDDSSMLDFVSALGPGPDGSAFAMITAQEGAQVRIVQIHAESSDLTIIWAADEEADPGSMHVAAPGFADLIYDPRDAEGVAYATVVRVALPPL